MRSVGESVGRLLGCGCARLPGRWPQLGRATLKSGSGGAGRTQSGAPQTSACSLLRHLAVLLMGRFRSNRFGVAMGTEGAFQARLQTTLCLAEAVSQTLSSKTQEDSGAHPGPWCQGGETFGMPHPPMRKAVVLPSRAQGRA